MTAYIALLRGINVGGKNSLPMRDLRDILQSLGCGQVKTYIQSGNIVCHSDAKPELLRAKITVAIEQKFGFAPFVLLLSATEFQVIVAANPFPEAIAMPKSLHVVFLARPAVNPDRAMLEALRSPTERYVLTANALYLNAPDGIGGSRLAGRLEHCLGVATTARNWRTVSAVAAIVHRSFV